MTRVRRAAAAAALTVPLLLATGCGIATTGVVESGRAGTVKLATAPDPGLVYFIAPDGALVPVPVSDRMQRPDIGFTIGMLLEGPSEAAREAGLTTEVPAADAISPDAKAKGLARGPVEAAAVGNTVRVILPLPVEPLSGPARRQLACTALAAVSVRPAPEILLVGSDGKEQSAVCEVRPER
ncbi:hypothetical protein [Streptomyces sp. AP-93]|uniref:hypothetical protein n=1 Tax=Streptomyces sp. AP-93 TaxID=2929048 RepID=UPI001FAEE627|nr:hypothetical protein [Streptomyces sp. AP-93]MCJ0873368.1 hypothetical protein [Streptomyces sp. AP-93]